MQKLLLIVCLCAGEHTHWPPLMIGHFPRSHSFHSRPFPVSHCTVQCVVEAYSNSDSRTVKSTLKKCFISRTNSEQKEFMTVLFCSSAGTGNFKSGAPATFVH